MSCFDQKISIDLTQMDENGMVGPNDGKVSLNYEFCIPKDEKCWNEVQRIDKTAEKGNSKGRISCTDSEWLVIGSTHQKGAKGVLCRLSQLDYVKEIRQVFWE